MVDDVHNFLSLSLEVNNISKLFTLEVNNILSLEVNNITEYVV